jgi:hypothetical protein
MHLSRTFVTGLTPSAYGAEYPKDTDRNDLARRIQVGAQPEQAVSTTGFRRAAPALSSIDEVLPSCGVAEPC